VPTEVPTGDVGPHEWICYGILLYHSNQGKSFPNRFDLHTLTPGQSVGLLVTPNGQLHLFSNGEHCREIATGLPVDTPLWGVADVFGKCTKIKSDGESSGVVISPLQCVGEEMTAVDTERELSTHTHAHTSTEVLLFLLSP